MNVEKLIRVSADLGEHLAADVDRFAEEDGRTRASMLRAIVQAYAMTRNARALARKA